MTWVPTPSIGRRSVIVGASSATLSLVLPYGPGAAATKLTATPRQTAGPFYPIDWSGDIDNDLVVVTGEAATSLGQVVHIDGRVLDLDGSVIDDALVEIWQCDANGVYRHPRDERGTRRRDAGFQGRGRTRTDASGRYTFRTIRPVPYPGRTPHIHFAVDVPDRRTLVTQMYVFGEALNERDGILNSIRDPRQRDSVIVRIDQANGVEPGSQACTFDIVVG